MLSGAGLSIALVATGGFFGGVVRHAVTDIVARRTGAGFPWGTVAVNASGSFAIGGLAGVLAGPPTGPWAGVVETAGAEFAARLAEGDAVWAALGIGLLGAYTTVSSVSLQTLALWRDGRRAAALANLVGTAVLCLAAAATGLGAVHLVGFGAP